MHRTVVSAILSTFLLLSANSSAPAEQSRAAFCRQWIPRCQAGCIQFPGPSGVEACKRQVCVTDRYTSCLQTGCYYFRTGAGPRCMKGRG
jgi:hypothetical protein